LWYEAAFIRGRSELETPWLEVEGSFRLSLQACQVSGVGCRVSAGQTAFGFYFPTSDLRIPSSVFSSNLQLLFSFVIPEQQALYTFERCQTTTTYIT
jgi:hypothetical protein